MGVTLHYDVHDTAFTGDYRLLKKLLEDNPMVNNTRDEYGQSPLHKATMNGWFECVVLLLEFNSNANAVDAAGCTPLHYAASNGYLHITRYLIEHGHACITTKSNKGYTPQHMAKIHAQCKTAAFLEGGPEQYDLFP